MARKQNNKNTKANQNANFQLRHIKPLTKNQQKTFDAYDDDKNLVLHGYAGTGKSFISLYLALEDVLSGETPYKRIVIIRSVVPSRNMGFLPGSIKEKTRVYEEPYKQIIDDLFGRGDGYDVLKQRNIVEFTTTSYLRGLTFNNSIVIVDELQNMLGSELDTIMTRIGDNCRVIFSGDYRQSDFLFANDKKGLHDFLDIIKEMDDFEYVEFTKDDIVRSKLVKQYIINRTELGVQFV